MESNSPNSPKPPKSVEERLFEAADMIDRLWAEMDQEDTEESDPKSERDRGVSTDDEQS